MAVCRETSNVHLGRIILDMDASAGRGLRIDHSGSASPGKPMFSNYTIDYVDVSGSGGHGGAAPTTNRNQRL